MSRTTLSDRDVRALRLWVQRLVIIPGTDPLADVQQVVESVVGLQAQDAQAGILSVRVRSAGLTAADVEQSLLHERSIVRTWAMRGTLHLVATLDLPWIVGLLGPIFGAGDKRRRLQLGLDDATAARGVHVIRDALAAHGPLTRAELLQALMAEGINAEGQGVIHLIALAAWQGLVCLGPDRGNKPTYAHLPDWIEGFALDSPLSREESCAQLARRYLAAYNPALPEDFAAWSGLPMTDVRAAWKRLDNQHELVEVEMGNGPAWMLKSCADFWLDRLDRPDRNSENSPSVRLLPAFDTFWMGYRSRDLAVAPQYAKRINAGGGIIHPALLVNGHAEGLWKIARRKDRIEVGVTPFEPLGDEIMPGLEAEAADVARFLGAEATLSIGKG